MLFNSWTFAVFMVATFFGYHFIPWREGSRVVFQITLLTLASYVFYAWHTPWLVLILAASTAINAYVTLRLLSSARREVSRRKLLLFGVVANLAVLAFFKYASLLVKSIFPHSWWSHWGFDLTQIPLPVGISFFTFQGISLVVDVYRSGSVGIEGVRNPSSPRESRLLVLRIAFFKAFFPQLVAGPIVKAHEFMYQIVPKSLRDVNWDAAIRCLILGYFLKMVVADNLKEATAQLSYPAFLGLPGLNLLFLLYGFSFQIFADFAGYSLIAIGLGRLFGYELPVNFNFPYIARSITEFWRRWHISLSTWLREYLYYPLGGNRKGPIRTYVNLIVVMLLGGLWHGAAWSYMVWGGAHGLFLAIERSFGVKGSVRMDSQSRISKAGEGNTDPGMSTIKTSGIQRLQPLIRSGVGGALTAVKILVTFHLVSLLWLLFQLPKFDEALLYLRELGGWKAGLVPQPAFSILLFGSPVVLYHLWALARPGIEKTCTGLSRNPLPFLRDFAYAVLLFLILTNSGSPGEFIYFQF